MPRPEILEGIEPGGACHSSRRQSAVRTFAAARRQELKIKTIISFGSADNADCPPDGGDTGQ